MYGEQLAEATFPETYSEPSPVTDIFREYVSDFVAGLLGGCASLVIGHPFDTIKFRGFFKGMAFPLASVGMLNSVFFGVYGNTMRAITYARHGKGNGRPQYSDIFIAGGIGGGIQAVPACPIELVKVKLQSQTDVGTGSNYRGPMQCIRTIYKFHGLQGCFRGLNATISREMVGFSCYITSYQWMCDKLSDDGKTHVNVFALLMAGGLAGTLSWIVNMPLDVTKSLMQADDLANPRYRGMWHCMVQSYKTNGHRIFWRGLPVACIRAFPTNAVTFVVYSRSLEWMQGRQT